MNCYWHLFRLLKFLKFPRQITRSCLKYDRFLQNRFIVHRKFFSRVQSSVLSIDFFRIVADPVLIMLKREELSLDSIKQYYIMVQNADQKLHYLFALYRGINIGAAIIFCHTRKFSEKVMYRIDQ